MRSSESFVLPSLFSSSVDLADCSFALGCFAAIKIRSWHRVLSFVFLVLLFFPSLPPLIVFFFYLIDWLSVIVDRINLKKFQNYCVLIHVYVCVCMYVCVQLLKFIEIFSWISNSTIDYITRYRQRIEIVNWSKSNDSYFFVFDEQKEGWTIVSVEISSGIGMYDTSSKSPVVSWM